jgi:hypothetical protein
MNRDDGSQKWRLEGDYFEGCKHSILDSLILANSIGIPIWAYDFFYFCFLSLVIDSVNTRTHCYKNGKAEK